MRISTGSFGVFVIFAAVHTFLTLVVGSVSLSQYQVAVSEVLKPLAAIFGFPSVAGLLFGQFVANTSSSLGAVDLVSPVFTFLGLLFILYLRNYSVLVGSLLYTIPTTLWLSYMLEVASDVSFFDGIVTVLPGQVVALVIGYAIYQTAERTRIFSPRNADESLLRLER